MLAVSLATYEIWATPKLFDAQHAPDVARLLDMPPKELLRRVNAGRSFVLLKRQVDADTATQVAGKALAGVTLVPDTKRFYPGRRIGGACRRLHG